MGDRRWEWALPNGEVLVASVDESSGVESVWLGERLVSRSGPRGKAGGHAFSTGATGATEDACVTFDGKSACALVVKDVRATLLKSPAPGRALLDASSSMTSRIVQRIALFAVLAGIFAGILFIARSIRREFERPLYPTTTTGVVGVSSVYPSSPLGSVFIPPLGSASASNGTATPAIALAGRIQSDAPRPDPTPAGPAIPIVEVTPTAPAGGNGETGCTFTFQATSPPAAGGYDHIVALSSHCDRAMSCTVSTSAHPQAQTVRIAPRGAAQITTYQGNPLPEFTPRIACEQQGDGIPVPANKRLAGRSTVADCLSATRGAVRKGGRYDHIVRLTNRCDSSATCTLGDDNGSMQTVTVGGASAQEFVTASNQGFELFSARIACDMGFRPPVRY